MDGSLLVARWRKCASPPNTCFLGHIRVHIPNGILIVLIGSAVFAQFMAERPYTLQWAALSPWKLPLLMEWSSPPSNICFLWLTQVLNPNGILISSAIFAGLTSVADRQTDSPTDHATRLVTIGRDNLACNFTICWLILKFFHKQTQLWICSKLSLKMPQYLKCLNTVPCDLSLITMPVSNCHLFSDINVSHSNVFKVWWDRGSFSYHVTANLSLSLTVKEFWKSVKVWQSYHDEFGGLLYYVLLLIIH